MAMLAKEAAKAQAAARAARAVGHFRRFAGYDYARGGSIFITATLAERRPLFGRVEHDHVALSPAGEVLAAQIARVKGEFPRLTVRSLVIMPDHLHLRLTFPPGLETPVADIGNFVGRIKQYSQYYLKAAGMCGAGLWQPGYHDHLCLIRFINDQVDKYIANNPLKWWLMHDSGLLRVDEPLLCERLPREEWWSGVGNRALLGAETKICAVQLFEGGRLLLLSRQVEAEDRYSAWHGINAALGAVARLGGDDLYVRPDRLGRVDWLFNDRATEARLKALHK